MKLQGSIVALVTPFHEDGTVNFERLGEILDWHIAQGTDGILVLGTTGESSTMSHEEDDEVCRFTIDRVAGRVPVIAGSGSNSTETQMEKSVKYAKMGADALLCITPYYIKANGGRAGDFIQCPRPHRMRDSGGDGGPAGKAS